MDSALPQIPGAAAPQATPFQQPGMAQPQQARPPGRPAEDPQKQEERGQRHAERKRLEAALPKRATEAKVQLFRKDPRTGRRNPTARPVVTVLLSDLEAAKEENVNTDEYLQDLLLTRLGDRAEGVYEAVTVDRRGSRLDFPAFDVVVGEEPPPDGEGDDEGLSPEEEAEIEREEAMQRGPAAAPFAPPAYEPPPRTQQLDMGVIDDVARKNRDEAKNDTASTMALVMQAMTQGQQALAAAQAQQTQLMVAALTQQRPPEGGNKELMVALVTALAPILHKMTEPKPVDPVMMALLTRAMERPERADPMATVTGVITEVMKMGNGMMADAAKNAMTMQANHSAQSAQMQTELTKGLIQNTLSMIKDQRNPPKEAEGDGGGGMMESVAKIAAAVLPAMMGQKGDATALATEEAAALPAPAPVAPRQVRTAPKTPPPAAPAAAAPPAARAPLAAPTAPFSPYAPGAHPNDRAAAPAAVPQPAAPAPSFTPPAQSALPPVQQPAAPAPPGGGIPAIPEPPKRTRKPRAAPAAAAPAPQPAAPAPATTAVVETSAPAGGALSVLPAGSWMHALMAQRVAPAASGLGRAMSRLQGSGGVPNVFPTMYMTEVGLFDRDAMNPEGSDANLPVGREPFYAVYLGCRLKIVCWPKAADRNSANRESPRWQANIGEDQPDWLEIAGQAISAYQFTNKDRRPALFDALGHPRGSLELLWFDPEAGIIVTRTQNLVNAMNATWANLMSSFPQAPGLDGVMQSVVGPFPAMVSPGASESINSKSGQQWEEYPIQITQQASGDGLAAWQAFEQWIATGGYTAEVDKALREWSASTITPEQVEILRGVHAAKAQR
jgi:hypothetical protein